MELVYLVYTRLASISILRSVGFAISIRHDIESRIFLLSPNRVCFKPNAIRT